VSPEKYKAFGDISPNILLWLIIWSPISVPNFSIYLIKKYTKKNNNMQFVWSTNFDDNDDRDDDKSLRDYP